MTAAIWLIARSELHDSHSGREYRTEVLDEDYGWYASFEEALDWCSQANRSLAEEYNKYRNKIAGQNAAIKPEHTRAMRVYTEALKKHKFLKSGGFTTTEPKLPVQHKPKTPLTFGEWWAMYKEWHYGSFFLPLEVPQGVKYNSANYSA